MKIKRYLDTDMRKVLRRVREEQGPDAVILSNRRVDEGIEVVAAVDYDEALIRHAIGSQPTAAAFSRIAEPADTVTNAPDEINFRNETDVDVIASDLREVEPTTVRKHESVEPITVRKHKSVGPAIASEHESVEPATARGPENPVVLADETQASLTTVQSEIASVRELLESQLSGLVWKDGAKHAPERAQVLRNLARIGVAPDIANIIVNRLEPLRDIKQIWRSPLAELAQLVPVKEDNLLTQGGIVALIGPTGVGKTTTIAKIATRYAMAHGSEDIALICADAYRIGAKEHLTAFGHIIGVKVHAASTTVELNDLLDRLQSKKLILIDTEGMSQRDMDLANRLAAYGSNMNRVHFYLTLSAASQEAGLDETIRQFSKVPLAGAVVSKIDEAGQLGCVISALIRNDLPALWFSDGQRIPDDLHTAARKRLWLINQAVECMEASEPRVDERTMAENYAIASIAHG
ncbi:MAG: flagellar biosynthesis protein FlhF [Gammaproteobacteria bacterium]|nr:flagellar biosynthesis protein FlhF [Gammaproteobacteria bacterium]